MKFLLALFALTSFSAFANLQATLNNPFSEENDIKKALLVEISRGGFACSGSWTNVNAVSPVLTSTTITDWKFSSTASNTNPTITGEAKFQGGKLLFTFYVSEDLKRVNSFKYQQWEVTVGETNIGTLMKPIFKYSDTLTNEAFANCSR